MIKRKTASILLAIVSISLLVYFLWTTQIRVEFTTYFKPEYYLKFSLLIISAMLFNAAILLFRNAKGTNLALAIFGYTVVEEILFDLIGVTAVNMPLFAYIVLFICAVPCIWIAHSNLYKTEKLSIKELMIGLVIGAFESLLPLLF